MSLKNQILDDMKKFMREKNEIALGAIRMLRAEIKNAEIDKKKELDDDEVIQVVQSAIKKRKDAVEQYEKAGRADLAEKEKKEIEILSKYLPEQLSEEELKKIIEEEIGKLESKDKKYFGQVMKGVMSKVKGRADGKLVNKLVNEAFNGGN
ncbi:GatB/YqeY domain-containing protein [Deferribacter autotrophicus]|uniref:GatB/YqeY domain-containing protein n=1 Tax=Deferribacter autotrophicus TaxID=500465 RepID=A0A5A8F5U8_9BACT|nr:GatB/YqeY domain-containing protein [Deferribacter autotrophicus]KAA0258084.1 GatB/YqeY domain-containing protein [Deferribacter autotrophicus]